MNEQHAKAKGYIYTGIYGRNRTEIKERFDKEFKGKYQAMICDVPDSPLSRGGVGKGYSICAEIKYHDDCEAERLRKHINAFPAHLEYLKNEYELKVAAANKENNQRLEWIKEKGYNI